MKRFLTLALILVMSAGVCYADEVEILAPSNIDNVESVEDINNLFVEDAQAEEIVPIKEVNPLEAPAVEVQKLQEQPVNLVVTQSDEQFVATPEQSAQLEGYLQYNEQPAVDEDQNAIYFDGSDVASRINFTNPKKITSKSLLGSKKPVFTPMGSELSSASRFSSQEYMINPVSTSYSQKLGNVTFGTVYDASLDSASINYTTSVFSKFENKHFALSTAFAKDTNLNESTFGDRIYVIPELKLTKRLSLLNVWQTDTNQINKKNEVVLRYTPNIGKYADDVQFEVGAGQSFYNDEYVKSSLRFSTKFKL